MKYVRTKDSIYEFVDYDEGRYRANILGAYWPKIIKQAKTIDELIDAYFVVSKKDDSRWCVVGEKDVAEIYNGSDYGYYVYGAIKIKENNQYILKTVTKPMNEKGELELEWL